MIGFFPDPYPDELLYSACARFGDRSGYRNVAIVARELFGSQTGIANIGFPNRLAHLISVLPSGHEYTVDGLIDDHTLLRFYSPFISSERVKIIREEMAGAKENRIHSRLGINAGRLSMPSKLRFCPDCATTDRDSYSEAYWHRVHQLPGIEVCPDHWVFLELSNAGWRERESCTAFVSAEIAIGDARPRRLDPRVQRHSLLLEVAKEAQWIMNWRGTPLSKSVLRSRYCNHLLRRGLAYYNGRIKHTELLKQFTEFYSRGLLQSLQSDIGNQRQPWPLRLVRQNRVGEMQPPLRHLLFMRFLGCRAEQFLNEFDEHKPFGDGPWPCLNRAASHFEEAIVHTCRITNGQKNIKGRPVGVFSCSCGFRYLRVGPDNDDAARLRFNRVISYGPVWEEFFRQRWNDASVTLTDFGADLNVIPFTLRRHAIRLGLPFPRKGRWARPTSEKVFTKYGKPRKTFDKEMEARRKQWLSVRKQNPRARRKHLITLAPYAYYWLSRHDPKWLDENMPRARVNKPEPVRVSWKTWDRRFPKAIEKLAQEIRTRKGPPIRVSKEEIIRRLEHRAWLEHHLDKLPKTALALGKFVESREEFLIRRVRWTESTFVQERRCPTRHQFAVRAGTRTKTGDARQVQAAVNIALRNLENSQ